MPGMLDKWFLRLLGAAFMLTGAVLWAHNPLRLPTRHPPEELELAGLALLLFGLSPMMLGIALWWIGGEPTRRDGRGVQAMIAVSVSSILLALLLAQRD